MPDPVTPAAPAAPVAPAASTPAIVPPPEQASTPDDMASYRRSRRQSLGVAPKPQAGKDEGLTPPGSEEDPDGEHENETPSGEEPETPSKPAAASEAAPPQGKPKKRSDAAQRIQELLEENRQLRLQGGQKPDATQNSSTAQAAKQPEPPKLRPEPKLEDVDEKTGKKKYASWDEWFTDVRKWEREAVLHEVDQRTAKSRQTETIESQKRSQAEKWKGQVDQVRKEFKDFDAVALTPELGKAIPQGSVVEAYVLRREDGARMLYHLGQHPEKLAEILKMDPFDQSGALLEISRGFAKKPEAGAKPAEGAGAKPAGEAPPAKKISQAPATPIDVGGGNGPVPDEMEQAVKDGDMEAYRHGRRARVLAR